jgi:hypothetical protein
LHSREFRSFGNRKNYFKSTTVTFQGNDVRIYLCLHCITVNNNNNFFFLEKISILPLVISATGIVPQSLFKNLKILDLDNTLVVEIQKGILLYSCHIVRKFLNIDTEYNTQQSQNAEARRR